MTEPVSTLIIIGNGFLARYCRDENPYERVVLVNRTEQGSAAGQPYGDNEISLVCDITRLAEISKIVDAAGDSACDVVFMVPPSTFDSAKVMDELRPTITLLQTIELHRLVVVSSSGVYADSAAAEIDAGSPTPVKSDRVRRLLDIENAFRSLHSGTVVLRLVGLYSERRIVGARQLRQNQAVSGDGDSWLNLIHAEDAARVIARLFCLESAPPTLLLSDGCPLRRQDYYAALAHHLGTTVQFNGEPLRRGAGYKADSSETWQVCDLSPLHADARSTLKQALG